MVTWTDFLNTFLQQAQGQDLKTSAYPKEWGDLRMRVSFGMGAPARVPWIAFVAPEMQVSKGFYPVYLFYKEFETLILAYGVSETEHFSQSWPVEIMSSTATIAAHFDKDVPRYGDSFVFKAYKIKIKNGRIEYTYPDGSLVTSKDIESDLSTLLEIYKKLVSVETSSVTSVTNRGIFYMEKQLEDFIIHNWENTELGKKYDLIIEDGELISQQYHTDIGPIDILVRDKKTKNFVVIELKRNQTSDDTVGQIARYMGWIKKIKGDNHVKGIIIAGEYDRKLEYALTAVPNVEVFIYKVIFELSEFKGLNTNVQKPHSSPKAQ